MEFVATTCYVLKYARWLLNHAEEVQQTRGRSHLRRYGPDVQHVLFLAWRAANRICAKRLGVKPRTIQRWLAQQHGPYTGEGRGQVWSASPCPWLPPA